MTVLSIGALKKKANRFSRLILLPAVFVLFLPAVGVWAAGEKSAVVEKQTPSPTVLDQLKENWTRVSSELLGTVFLYLDYTVPVEAIREELQRVLQASGWDLRCEVREKMIAFVQRNYPQSLPKMRAQMQENTPETMTVLP
nr:hypothetical protein [uncultured Desulfobacter sp.]